MNKIITIEIYNRDVMVHFGSKKELRKELLNYHKPHVAEEIIKEINFDADGHTLYDSENGAFIVAMPSKPTTPKEIGTLIHELSHATNAIMEAIGVTLTESSEEAYTYCLGFLTRKVFETFAISS